MRALLISLLALGCATATTSPSADAGDGDEPMSMPPGQSDAKSPGQPDAKGPGQTGPDGAPPPGDAIADPGIIPPSRRDGGIPPRPPGSPPCAADSNAADGNACPYKFIVECTLTREAGPAQTCICVGSLGGKWYCSDARDTRDR